MEIKRIGLFCLSYWSMPRLWGSFLILWDHSKFTVLNKISKCLRQRDHLYYTSRVGLGSYSFHPPHLHMNLRRVSPLSVGLLFQREGEQLLFRDILVKRNSCHGSNTGPVLQASSGFSQSLLAGQGKSLGGLWSKACSVNCLESVVPEESSVPLVHKIYPVPAICLQLQVTQSVSALPYCYFAVLGCFSQKKPCERTKVSFRCLCPFIDLLPNAMFKVGMTIGVFEDMFCSVNLGP